MAEAKNLTIRRTQSLTNVRLEESQTDKKSKRKRGDKEASKNNQDDLDHEIAFETQSESSFSLGSLSDRSDLNPEEVELLVR